MMTNIYCRAKSLLRNQKGQGLVEYGLLLAGVAVVGVAVYTLLTGSFGTSLNTLFTNISDKITTASGSVN